MNIQHPTLAAGKWKTLTFFEQMANIGSEVERAINWRRKNNQAYCRLAAVRALELIDLTLALPYEYPRLREIARMRELLSDDLFGENKYKSTAISWHNYFFAFNYALARKVQKDLTNLTPKP